MKNKEKTVKKLSGGVLTMEEINKQTYLVMSNINAVKITTNITENNHETLMKSFFILQNMFNTYLQQNGVV